MDPPELASEPPRSRIGAASNSAHAFNTIGLGNVRVQIMMSAFSSLGWMNICFIEECGNEFIRVVGFKWGRF